MYARSIHYTFILVMSEILGNIYIWLFLEKCFWFKFCWIYFGATVLKTVFYCTFWRLKILVLWQKIVKNLLVFVYLSAQKKSQLILENFHNSQVVGRRKLLDLLLNHVFNALSICVQYTLSFQWKKFGLVETA